MTVLKVRHVTTYSYARPVRFGEHRIMFRPRDTNDQRLLSADLETAPDADIGWVHDVFGNCITIASFSEAASELRFESNIVLDHNPERVPHFRIDPRARIWPFEYDADIQPDLAPYLRVHHPAPEVEAFARKFTRSGLETETGHLLMTMTMGIRESLRYNRRVDPGTQLPVQTLTMGSGACRDYALLMIEACRTLGLAARFVTGYIYVPGRDTRSGVRGGHATHAWVQVFLPGAGWVEFDPTNGIVGSKDLIRVGVAREPKQARPLSGSFIGDRKDYLGMTVDVHVTRQKPPGAAKDAPGRRSRTASGTIPAQPAPPRD